MVIHFQCDLADIPGCLDNKTIVRFTHLTDNAAGTEIHLEYLNKILLQRNKLTIFQFYMPSSDSETEKVLIGQGTLIKIPLKFIENKPKFELLHQKILRNLKYLFSLHDCYNPHYRSAIDFEKKIISIFSQTTIDIAINHFPGGLDSLIFMKEAGKRNIPVCVINHFNNRWFNQPPIRKQLYYSRMTAGLSNVNVPRFLEKKFINLSNGIDTDFFNPDAVAPTNMTKIILLLPARIVPNKGHHDLLHIIKYLKERNINCLAVFVGKQYDVDYKTSLDTFIRMNNLTENTIFTGELSQEALRQWYRDSTLTILPTTHDEGLPRVIIESQSMKVPPVCYNAGGISEAIIQNETGYYVKKGDFARLKNHITELLSSTHKREQMGVSGRNFIINNFSLTAQAIRHEQLYLQLMSDIGGMV
jgi:glycosyltransferase involved in cell wall biosynthesis